MALLFLSCPLARSFPLSLFSSFCSLGRSWTSAGWASLERRMSWCSASSPGSRWGRLGMLTCINNFDSFPERFTLPLVSYLLILHRRIFSCSRKANGGGGAGKIKWLSASFQYYRFNKCSDRSIKVKLSAPLGNFDWPTNQLTDQRTDRIIGKFYFQQAYHILCFSIWVLFVSQQFRNINKALHWHRGV